MSDYQSYTLNILNELISFNTVNEPGNEDPLARFLQTILSSMGFETSLVSCGENRSSVVAYKGNPKGKRCMLNGHLDVVPVSGNWVTDPFSLVRDGDRVYGRGTADMKGGIASMIAAVRQLSDEEFDFANGQLILAFVADEELFNKGTRSILALPELKDVDYAVIGEPTNLDICVGHRGTARFVIRLIGRPCHSSEPEKGVNAISRMSRLIQLIDDYNEDLKSIHHPIFPSPTIAVVMISGGEKDNIIPGGCEINIDRRTLPSEGNGVIREEIQRILETLKKEYDDFSYEIEQYIDLEAGEISLDAPLIEKTKIIYKHCFDEEPVLKAFKATCEQSIFIREGIQTLIFGPGNIKQAHIDNEYTSVSQLYEAADFYYHLVKDILS